MADSKKVAEAVALQHLGYHVIQGSGAVVRSARAGTPAASVLQANDVIVGVDGKPVAIEAEAVSAIKAHKPGDRIQLSVTRGAAPARTVETTLAQGPDGRGFLGVVLETAGLQIKLPFQIDIDSGSVVGPSAGVAYALELLDVLTPGELTGGGKIAATGDLQLDGTIDAIGGVAQKAVTVRRAGASVFLVPKANYAEAKAHAGSHLKVIAVGTFDDALRVLGSLQGSNALALERPSSGT
jgi:Lon-like protease